MGCVLRSQAFNKKRLTRYAVHTSQARTMASCAPTGIRTPVLALKGLRPSPLDDGGILPIGRRHFTSRPEVGQVGIH